MGEGVERGASGRAASDWRCLTFRLLSARRQYWRLRDKSGKPPGLIGWWPGRAVTFIDNHDTGSTQRHWPFPDDSLGEVTAGLWGAV